MNPFEIATDSAALAAAAALRVTEAGRAAVAERGRFTLAVSGGRIAGAFFAELARADLPWDAVHVLQVDERVAPDGHPDRNLTALQAGLLDQVAIPAANVHAMPVTAPDLAAAAADYARELAGVAAGSVLDLVQLGLGDDGHTASWPPGDPVVGVDDADVAVAGPYRGRLRMTLTPPAVNRARAVLWLVDGAGKAPVLRRLLAGDPALPAARVRVEGATILATAEAAGA